MNRERGSSPIGAKEYAQPVGSSPLIRFLRVLFRRKMLIALSGGAILTAVLAVTFLTPATFRATAKLLLEREVDSEKTILLGVSVQPDYSRYDWVNAEIEILTSGQVAARALEKVGPVPGSSHFIRTGSSGTKTKDQEVMAFLKRLQVASAPKTNVVQVSFEAENATYAAAAANAVVEAYTIYRAQLHDQSESYKFFQEQLRLADAKLRELQEKQANYKQAAAMISPEAQRTVLLNRLSDYESRLTEVRTARIGKEARLEVLKKELAQGRVGVPSTEASDSPSREKHIAKLRGELLDLQMRREQLLTRFTPQYEGVRHIEKQIAATERQIAEEVEQIIQMETVAIAALRTEEEALQSSIARIKEDIQTLARQEYEYSQLSRGIDDNQQIYSMLLRQREEARISLAKMQTGVSARVINPAEPPLYPVRPRKRLNLALGLLLAMCASVTMAFVREYFDHTLHEPAELEWKTGLPVLGSVREVPRTRRA
ncbi:MAG: GumC family protein [candidate division KSB1 bacterium]|nr:GumC family protein [candidate division KSB1 bacterium]